MARRDQFFSFRRPITKRSRSLATNFLLHLLPKLSSTFPPPTFNAEAWTPFVAFTEIPAGLIIRSKDFLGKERRRKNGKTNKKRKSSTLIRVNCLSRERCGRKRKIEWKSERVRERERKRELEWEREKKRQRMKAAIKLISEKVDHF